jgi:hypothetical protein
MLRSERNSFTVPLQAKQRNRYITTGSITHGCYRRDDACVETRPKCRKCEESRAH